MNYVQESRERFRYEGQVSYICIYFYTIVSWPLLKAPIIFAVWISAQWPQNRT